MKQLKLWVSAAGAALILVACGGGSDARYSSLVTFGDSLSDAGTMKDGAIKALGGGRWTINSPDNKIWVDLLAAKTGLTTPCPALLVNTSLTVTVPVTSVTQMQCTNYAQGGSRVTNPVGPGNANLLPNAEGVLGQPTTPIDAQIANHLKKGKFTGNELVTVLAGGNDAFRLTATDPFTASVTAVLLAPGNTLSLASATQVVSGQVVAAMGQAGGELAAYVKTQIIANGAQRVVVVNLPNFGAIPATVSKGSDAIALGVAMSERFNKQLTDGLRNTPEVIIVDFYAELTKITTDAAYRTQVGVTNWTTAACAPNALDGRALVCNLSNLNAAAAPTADGYMFADDAHPTARGHRLLAQLVIAEMTKAGWL